MALEDELGAAVEAAGTFAGAGEALCGVIASEPAPGLRVYLCAYASDGELSWLALDRSGMPIADRALVREAVSIVGMCELAEESAGGGDVPALRRRLAELREAEAPEGIEEAEEAAMALESALEQELHVASPAYLDAVGSAATRLELTLGEIGSSPFANAMKSGAPAVEELARNIEQRYKRTLG
jgi:hypothetical protein